MNNEQRHDFIVIYIFFIMLFSCCRLRQVQALLCDSGSATPDGILCSLGMLSWKLNSSLSQLLKAKTKSE